MSDFPTGHLDMSSYRDVDPDQAMPPAVLRELRDVLGANEVQDHAWQQAISAALNREGPGHDVIDAGDLPQDRWQPGAHGNFGGGHADPEPGHSTWGHHDPALGHEVGPDPGAGSHDAANSVDLFFEGGLW
jgi:hypothetical protein